MSEKHPGKPTEAAPSNSVDRVPPWSTIEDPPEYNAENAKNPKESSDWLGGPQNGDETQSQDVDGSGGTWSGRGKPSEAAPSVTSQAGRVGTGNISGVDTQTGSQAKGMGSDGFTKHRFNETPSEASKQAPDRSGSQAYTDKLGGSSDN
ncbi:MAG TPA: hypothetical protein VK608_06350 [Edaphobacter sp.]|nr:hypothetical protein [Edaphobacter sp.]